MKFMCCIRTSLKADLNLHISAYSRYNILTKTAQCTVGRYTVPASTGSRPVFTDRQHGCTKNFFACSAREILPNNVMLCKFLIIYYYIYNNTKVPLQSAQC